VKSALACGINSLFQQAAYFTGQFFSMSAFQRFSFLEWSRCLLAPVHGSMLDVGCWMLDVGALSPMSDIAIRVEGLSKAYRIRLAEQGREEDLTTSLEPAKFSAWRSN
jgi:hypothetical protein